jgi:hypothetical protein
MLMPWSPLVLEAALIARPADSNRAAGLHSFSAIRADSFDGDRVGSACRQCVGSEAMFRNIRLPSGNPFVESFLL